MTAPDRTPEAWVADVLAEQVQALRWILDETCPHGPEEHAEGTCELCDLTFAVDAVVQEWSEALPAHVATILAARIAEAEAAAAEKALREVRFLAERWREEAEDRGPMDKVTTAGVAAMLLAAIARAARPDTGGAE